MTFFNSCFLDFLNSGKSSQTEKKFIVMEQTVETRVGCHRLAFGAISGTRLLLLEEKVSCILEG